VEAFLSHGTAFDDLASGLGIWESDEGVDAFVAAFRIDGAEPAFMAELLEEVLLPTFAAGAGEPRQEALRIGDRDVVSFTDEATFDPALPAETYYFTVVGDTIWMVDIPGGSEVLRDEALAGLPPS